MKDEKSISLLFYIGAAYDGLLGLVFLLFPKGLFGFFNVTPPNHFGYVKFPAALLIIFGVMFLAIAKNPTQNRNLIPYGIMLKISYCSIAFWYWFTTGIPTIWKPFAVCDLIFLALFFMAYKNLKKA